MSGRGAIFLDRDGTLNRKAPEGEYIRTPGELELLPGAASAVRRINMAGIPVILVTNQRWLSDPSANIDAYSAVQRELIRLLAAEGASLDACYVCPHARGSCDCRKPAPGMLLRAARDLGIDLSVSVVIGDAATDVQAGLAVRATTVLIDPRAARGRSGTREAGAGGSAAAHFAAQDIRRAVKWAIGQCGQGSLCYEEKATGNDGRDFRDVDR